MSRAQGEQTLTRIFSLPIYPTRAWTRQLPTAQIVTSVFSLDVAKLHPQLSGHTCSDRSCLNNFFEIEIRHEERGKVEATVRETQKFCAVCGRNIQERAADVWHCVLPTAVRRDRSRGLEVQIQTIVHADRQRCTLHHASSHQKRTIHMQHSFREVFSGWPCTEGDLVQPLFHSLQPQWPVRARRQPLVPAELGQTRALSDT
jgi:hypothetical protein